MKALIVEDEVRLARTIASVLEEAASFAVDISGDGEDGLHLARTTPYDVVILDLLLPKMGGLDVLRKLRAGGCTSRIIILTARDSPADVTCGLDLGADDYLTKPFEMTELVARCRALVRRAYDRPNPLITIGPLKINTSSRVVEFKGKQVALRAMEYRLLEYLAIRTGQIVSRGEILEHLYGSESERFSNVVEAYISFLRRRFDPGPEHELICTIRGQGYILGKPRV